MKKKLLLLSVIFCLALFVTTVLTACDNLVNILNGGGGGTDDSGFDLPTVIGLETVKADDDYLKSDEYNFNKQGTNPMAISFSEDYYLIIHYNNDAKLSISSIKVTWKNSNKPQPVTQTFNKNEFAEGSDYTATYIRFTSEDESSLRTGTIEYTVNSVLYVNGSSTTKMIWDTDVSKNITVALRPSFTLTLNYMNLDKRKGKEQQSEIREISGVYYKTQMNSYIVSPDYNGASQVPIKPGGWVFAGWYTEPLGKGLFLNADSTYDFWCDMTLYAYYERMFDVEQEDLPQTITHTYLNRGSEATIDFNSGVVLKNRGLNKKDTVMSNIVLDIPDTIFIEKYNVTTTIRSDGIPGYSVNVTGNEYPVVRLGANVFTDYNTIVTASIGKYVREIGYGAFDGCTKMETCSFNSGSVLQYIGDYAFQETDALGRTSPFVLPNTVEYLGMHAFFESGWGLTRNEDNDNVVESRLCIPAHWTYIGYKCFEKTRFEKVVFKTGCHFEEQISAEEGKNDESATGSKTIRLGQNRIGARLFSRCYRLWYVAFESDKGKNNGLNIIPDACFDAGSWYDTSDKRDGNFACISYISFGEGLTYIGQEAFNYQVKIPELCLPISLKEVDRRAFYNCTSVTNLNFEHVTQETITKEGITKALSDKSQLKIMKSYAFANLTGIDVVYITSEYFSLYGNGIFQGCTRLKCIIFNNIQSADKIPTGFKSSNAKFGYSVAKGDVINDDEVLIGHEMSDFMYGAGEAGENDKNKQQFAITYSSPVRIFCANEYINPLKNDMLIGKRLTAGNTSSGTKSYNSQVFVHPLENLFEYKYEIDGDKYTVQVAVQEIYRASGGKPTDNVIGYSLVYWSARSEKVVLPTQIDLNLSRGNIIELAAYAVPTSVEYLKIPSCYTRLEHDALNGCLNLSKVEFEDIDKLTYIGQYAFSGTAIRSFTGGSALKAIGNYAFYRCDSLVWVDLFNTPIKNTKNGRITGYYQYKYEYELEDYDEDFSNCLGNSAFQACPALTWVRLPEDIKQIRTSTFNNCPNLKTVIIPTKVISDSTDASDDNCFYEYAQPRSIFDPEYLFQIYFYVHTDMSIKHNTILNSQYIGGKSYQMLESAPNHP